MQYNNNKKKNQAYYFIRTRWFWLICCLLVLFCFAIASYFNYNLSLISSNTIQEDKTCSTVLTDPVLFHLKTELGVSYKASHWFHMAENFMAHHSEFRQKNLQLCPSDLYYNFDKSTSSSYYYIIV
jgi:hypothetical protein